MNYVQATQEITVAIPEICDDLKKTTIENSYHIIEFLTDKIKMMIRENNTDCLLKCLQKMDELYQEGDKTVKNAIENSFIYSLDNCTAFCDKEYRDMIFSRLSGTSACVCTADLQPQHLISLHFQHVSLHREKN